MRGTVLQVSTSRGGVPKRPIPHGYLSKLGIEGDAVAHPQIHGGPHQAVLLIASEVVDDLAAVGWPVYYGALGENVTTRGLDHKQFRDGQQYRVGEAVIELTKPREPCAALSVYGRGIQQQIFERSVNAGDLSSRFWGMSGFYARVIREGLIRRGDPVVLLERPMNA